MNWKIVECSKIGTLITLHKKVLIYQIYPHYAFKKFAIHIEILKKWFTLQNSSKFGLMIQEAKVLITTDTYTMIFLIKFIFFPISFWLKTIPQKSVKLYPSSFKIPATFSLAIIKLLLEIKS